MARKKVTKTDHRKSEEERLKEEEEKREKEGREGDSICFLSGVQLEVEQTTKEEEEVEEEEKEEVPASLRTCLIHTCRLPQGKIESYFLLCVHVRVCVWIKLSCIHNF